MRTDHFALDLCLWPVVEALHVQRKHSVDAVWPKGLVLQLLLDGSSAAIPHKVDWR